MHNDLGERHRYAVLRLRIRGPDDAPVESDPQSVLPVRVVASWRTYVDETVSSPRPLSTFDPTTTSTFGSVRMVSSVCAAGMPEEHENHSGGLSAAFKEKKQARPQEIGGACLKMAGVERGSTDGRATPADPPARTFSVVSEKALDDLSSYEALLRDYSKQIDEIEVQLQCGTH